jgi:Ca2+:H+ antiporter
MRRILLALLLLSPIVVVLDQTHALGHTGIFVLAALALVPLAWLIGEATEQVAEYTGPGVGGFVNATFGNAPELIIALIAVHGGLTEVVRGSLAGSVIGNLLLVLGFAVAAGRGDLRVDRRSSFTSLSIVGLAVILFLVPAIPSWHGNPNRHLIAVLSIPVSIVLLGVYLVVTLGSLRRHRSIHSASKIDASTDEGGDIVGWSLRLSMGVLALATLATAFVAEALVGSLEAFARSAGLTDFFVAAVIVAIVGNAAEHGGAVLVAYRGKVQLAVEIALASSAQVAVFLIPAVALLSWFITPLALGFRLVELVVLAGALLVVALVLATGRVSRARGIALIVAYVAVAVGFSQVDDLVF